MANLCTSRIFLLLFPKVFLSPPKKKNYADAAASTTLCRSHVNVHLYDSGKYVKYNLLSLQLHRGLDTLLCTACTNKHRAWPNR